MMDFILTSIVVVVLIGVGWLWDIKRKQAAGDD